jgi:hypothetical protein
MSSLVMIRNVTINGCWVFLLNLLLVLVAATCALAQEGNVNLHEGNVQISEMRTGPFKISGRDFTLVKKVLKWEGAENGYDETVQSITIVDNQGNAHFQKSFVVDQGETAFMESVDVSAFALDSWGLKGFRVEGGKLKEMPQKDVPGAGLIVYYGVVPTAPMSGAVCQVFALKGDLLTPLFSPLSVYGEMYALPPGSTANSRKLFENDTMKFGVWNGWYEVVVPVRVFDNLRVAPLHYDLTSRNYAFEVIVERMPLDEDTFVRFFRGPGDSSIPKHLIVRKDSKIEFLWAYGKPTFKSGYISMEAMPWLKVRIDGKEGFVRDQEDLMALGLRQAG